MMDKLLKIFRITMYEEYEYEIMFYFSSKTSISVFQMSLVHNFEMKEESKFPDHMKLRCRNLCFWKVYRLELQRRNKLVTVKYKDALLDQEDLKLLAFNILGKCATTCLQVLIPFPVLL